MALRLLSKQAYAVRSYHPYRETRYGGTMEGRNYMCTREPRSNRTHPFFVPMDDCHRGADDSSDI